MPLNARVLVHPLDQSQDREDARPVFHQRCWRSQTTSSNDAVFAAVHESAPGPSRHFAAAQYSVALGSKTDINQRVGVMDSAGSDTPAAPVMAGAAGYFRPGLRCAPSGLQPLVTFYETTLDIRPHYSYDTILAH